jgi:hypothetical protein
MATPVPRPAPVKPATEVLEPSWFWQFLEGIAIGAATYNTEKQSDGRPSPLGKFR